MNLCRHSICVVIFALLSGSGSAQEVEKLTNLRQGGKLKGNEAPADDELLPLGSPALLRANNGPDRMVVKCNEGQTEEDCLETIMSSFPEGSVKVLHRLRKENAFAISVNNIQPRSMNTLGLEVSEDPIRKPLHIKESLQVHRELQFGQQVPYGIDMVKAQEAWEQFGVRGEGVKVCVLDTGLRSSHTDFNPGKLTGYNGNEAVTPWNSDGEGHGTHVTGTIAAADNTRGVVGVSPEVEIYTVRVFDNNGNFFGSDVIAAAEACQDAGANVISMSLGGPGGSISERNTFQDLYNDGIISVAAAGNSGGTDFLYPASYDIVVSVAAVSSSGSLASFSTRNSRVDVAAPGVNIRSTWNNGRYASLSGTSMACPHVSGVIALMLSYRSNATPDQVVAALKATAINPETNGRNDRYGHGIIDAVAAMNELASNTGGGGGGGSTPTPAPAPGPSPSCNGGSFEFELEFNTDGYGSESTWELINTRTGSVVVSGGPYGNNDRYTTAECVNRTQCYTLKIYDSYGDGLGAGSNGNDGYIVRIDGSEFASGGGDFGSEVEITGIGNCNGGGGGGGPPSCQEISMTLQTDRFGYETSYLLAAPDGALLWAASGLQGNRRYTETACIDPTVGCYRFQIGDSYGDGISGDGLTLAYAGQVVYEGGNFGRGGYRDFGDGCEESR